jgi:hypothetical protein
MTYDVIKVAFDPLGGHFCRYMSLGKWGPDARYDYYAVLKEMTEAQLHTYTPAQLESLLKHRVNVSRDLTIADTLLTCGSRSGQKPS